MPQIVSNFLGHVQNEMAFLFLNLGAQHFGIRDDSSRYPLYFGAAPIGASEKLLSSYRFSLFPCPFFLPLNYRTCPSKSATKCG